jgi:hypothetical protein
VGRETRETYACGTRRAIKTVKQRFPVSVFGSCQKVIARAGSSDRSPSRAAPLLMYTRDDRRATSFACLAQRRYETSYTITYVHLRAQKMDPAIRRRGRIHKQARHTHYFQIIKKVSVFSEPNLHRRVLVSRFTLFGLYGCTWYTLNIREVEPVCT